MHGTHDPRLVVLSALIAILTAAVAFGLVARATAASGRGRSAWVAGGAVAMGFGMWSAHFVGMLAFSLHRGSGEIPLSYDVPLVLLSILVALAGAALTLAAASRPALTGAGTAAAGLSLAAAVTGMHHVGMAAMRMGAVLTYDRLLLVLSLVVAVVASTVAIWLFRRLRNVRSVGERWSRVIASVAVGLAIASIHYSAMAAARFSPAPDVGVASGVLVASGGLALWVAGITLVVFAAQVEIGAATDRAQRAMMGETIRASEARLRLALSAADLMVWEWDPAARSVTVYTAAADGADDGERAEPVVMSASTFLGGVHPDDRERVESAMDPASHGRSAIEVEYRTSAPEGRPRWTYLRGHLTEGDGTTHRRAAGVGLDVTRRRELEEQLVHQAFHDPLTGLANRVLFHDRVEHALARGNRAGAVPTVLFLDLDDFKDVNDGFGHAAGDELLVEIARRLSSCMRAADTCARLGGDEFAVLLEDSRSAAEAAQRAAHLAERLIAAFRTPFVVIGTPMVTSVSIGIASAADGESAEVLLRNADLALYRAKRAGRGLYAAFEPGMHAAVRSRLEMEVDLRSALDEASRHTPDVTAGETQLALHYQPIVDLTSGTLVGFEALARWRHPRSGNVSPAEFIPVAEDSGLIVPLGSWVLREACRQVALWERERPAGVVPLRVSVNLSGRQIAQPDLPRQVAEALAGSGLPASSLLLEVTESVIVEDGSGMVERLRALRATGVGLAIDDFGTGYSSLAYLQRFPVDVLKMDRAFVEGLAATPRSDALASAIVALGTALGARVVAEGIETVEQWDRLREQGCHLGQGFYFARPLSPSAARAMLAEQDLAAAGLHLV